MFNDYKEKQQWRKIYHLSSCSWRQNGPKDKGHFDEREMKDIPGDASFLEMLDILNEQLVEEGKEPFVFDHDCREGICGMCSLYVDGIAPRQNRTRCHHLPALYA